MTMKGRAFLKGVAAATTGLIIGFRFEPRGIAGLALATEGESAGDFALNAFIRIAPDSTVTIFCKHIEFGQEPFTGFATIIADELDASPDQIKVEHAPADVKNYANLFSGMQGTGGSSAMANSWDQLRKAIAEARARLVAAAAKEWRVPADSIAIENGVLKHSSGKSAPFGQFVGVARTVALRGEPKPKAASQWRSGSGSPA